MTTIPEFEKDLKDGKIGEGVITEQYIDGTLKGTLRTNAAEMARGRCDSWMANG